MESKNWEKVKEIVCDALDLKTSERKKFLDNADLNADIRAEVESLLAFEKESEKLIDISVIGISRDSFDAEEAKDLLVGQNIGVYTVVRELGYGGMGAVYLAERNDGKFEQKVALKLLKREMNTSALRRRFQQEREILASLEHPNIARLLDAGTTIDKVPYLAMEYVEGIPIDKYCNKHQLELNARLDLFRSVCSAVNFAHRNLVVHRDLKPSNILVNDEGVPKLLDFGISKILSAEFEQINSATVTKLGVMTPSYASPEQLKNESVTTATDIYSLGVILYELLSGHRPFESKENDLREIYKAVIENAPPLPSSMIDTIPKEFKKGSAFSTMSKPLTDSESNIEILKSEQETVKTKIRHTIPHKVSLNSNSLRGDLDNIVLKALRKEPERRYSSAENFSEDLKNYLRGLPVTARPNTFSYRAEKFIKRNQTSVLAGFLIVLAIIAGIIATFWQARVAAAERDRARLESEKVKKINAYTQNILNFSNPHWLSSNPKRNREAKISDALDEALKNIESDLVNEPEIQAELLFTIGQTYVGQGQFDKAEKLLRQSIEKFNQVFGNGNLKAEQATIIQGDALSQLGRFDEAEKYYLEAINYFRPIVVEDKAQLKWLVIALNDLGNVYSVKGKFAEQESIIKESLEFAKNLTGKDRYAYPIVLGNKGAIFFQKGNFPSALESHNQAFEELRLIGNEQRLEGGSVLTNIARTYNAMGDFQKAEEYYQKGYEILVKAAGDDYPSTIANRSLYADNCLKQEKYDEAKEVTERNLVTQRKLYPNGHFSIAYSKRFLGVIYTKTGELKKGETEIRESLEMLSKTLKEPNQEISLLKRSLGENLIAQKRFPEAEEVLNSALDGYIKTFGEEHAVTKKCRELLSKIPK